MTGSNTVITYVIGRLRRDTIVQNLQRVRLYTRVKHFT